MFQNAQDDDRPRFRDIHGAIVLLQIVGDMVLLDRPDCLSWVGDHSRELPREKWDEYLDEGKYVPVD